MVPPVLALHVVKTFVFRHLEDIQTALSSVCLCGGKADVALLTSARSKFDLRVYTLDRLEQDVPLSPERELARTAVRRDVRFLVPIASLKVAVTGPKSLTILADALLAMAAGLRRRSKPASPALTNAVSYAEAGGDTSPRGTFDRR